MKELDVQELMLTKDFEALSAAEQSGVLAVMTAEDYTDQRAVLLAFGDMTTDERLPDPDAAILASLKAQHETLHARPSDWAAFVALLFRPLPAYQTIGALSIALFASFFWFSNTSSDNPLPLSRGVDSAEGGRRGVSLATSPRTVHDTITVIKEIPVEVERIVYRDRPVLASLPAIEETDEGPFEPIVSTLPEQGQIERSYGNSGVNSDDLDRLREITYTEGL